MKCLITEKETSNRYKGKAISKKVEDFAKLYRDKLNEQQKQKAAGLIQRGKKITSKNHFVTTSATINMFGQMKEKMTWEKILITLTDELVLKGLLDEHIQEETIEKYC